MSAVSEGNVLLDCTRPELTTPASASLGFRPLLAESLTNQHLFHDQFEESILPVKCDISMVGGGHLFYCLSLQLSNPTYCTFKPKDVILLMTFLYSQCSTIVYRRFV